MTIYFDKKLEHVFEAYVFSIRLLDVVFTIYPDKKLEHVLGTPVSSTCSNRIQLFKELRVSKKQYR
jgi:hypothetical protein